MHIEWLAVEVVGGPVVGLPVEGDTVMEVTALHFSKSSLIYDV